MRTGRSDGTGRSGALGDVRARALQLRVHDRSDQARSSRLYQVDGIFSNRWSGLGHVLLRALQTNFKKFSGLDLPRTPNPQDPARRHTLCGASSGCSSCGGCGTREIKKINPEASYIANAGGGRSSDLDMKTIGELAPTLFADRQARRGVMPPWANGKNGKEYRATMGSKADRRHFQRRARGAVPLEGLGAERRGDPPVGGWTASRNDLRPWFTKFNGKLLDQRWLPVGRGALRLALPQREVSAQRALAGARRRWSTRSRRRVITAASRRAQKVEDHALGFYQALVEARIPFEMVHDQLLDAEHLGRSRR